MKISKLFSVFPAWLIIIFAGVSIQLGAAFAKDLFLLSHPITVVWLRLLFAALFFWLVAPPIFSDQCVKDWIIVLGYAFCLVTMNICIYLAIARIPLGLAVTIEFLGPLTLALFQSRHWLDLLWAVLAGIGVMLLGFTPGSYDPIGMGFAVLAAACWAGYIALAGPTARHWPGLSGLSIACSLGAVCLAFPALFLASGSLMQPQVLLIGLVVALLSSILPYTLELEARRRVKAGLFGILMSLDPALAALSAWVVLNEKLSVLEWLAMACIVTASAGATYFASRLQKH